MSEKTTRDSFAGRPMTAVFRSQAPRTASKRPAHARDDCWNHIGVNGDATCSELAREIHCRNCPVYADSGRGLLDREVPADYRDEWTVLLAAQKESAETAAQSVIIFTLGEEYLALPTSLFREVSEARVIHRLPGKRSKALLGLINIRGEIQLCVSLASLLGVGADNSAHKDSKTGDGQALRRMLVVERAGETWVFPVTWVHGIYRFRAGSLRASPSTLEKVPVVFSRGTFEWEGRTVGSLNEEEIFAALKRSVS